MGKMIHSMKPLGTHLFCYWILPHFANTVLKHLRKTWGLAQVTCCCTEARRAPGPQQGLSKHFLSDRRAHLVTRSCKQQELGLETWVTSLLWWDLMWSKPTMPHKNTCASWVGSCPKWTSMSPFYGYSLPPPHWGAQHPLRPHALPQGKDSLSPGGTGNPEPHEGMPTSRAQNHTCLPGLQMNEACPESLSWAVTENKLVYYYD